jgi:hypothetical protein
VFLKICDDIVKYHQPGKCGGGCINNNSFCPHVEPRSMFWGVSGTDGAVDEPCAEEGRQVLEGSCKFCSPNNQRGCAETIN